MNTIRHETRRLLAALALVLTSFLGVLAGGFIGQHVSERTLRWVAGLGFIAVGVWTLVSA